MKPLARREIIGTLVSLTEYSELLDTIDAAIARHERMTICCAPASTLIFARRDPALRAALAAADVVTPDGIGVVHAARLLGERLDDRVYGPDLMLMQCERAARSGHRVWLYGGHDVAALGELRARLTERFPGLEFVGWECPPFRPPTDQERRRTAERINEARADLVWVGLGSPKQELWMHSMRPLLNAPVLCGVGAAFDFHAGRVSQAPRWLRDHGLEWLFRLVLEPLRLGRRYLSTLPQFAVLVLAQSLRERRRR